MRICITRAVLRLSPSALGVAWLLPSTQRVSRADCQGGQPLAQGWSALKPLPWLLILCLSFPLWLYLRLLMAPGGQTKCGCPRDNLYKRGHQHPADAGPGGKQDLEWSW